MTYASREFEKGEKAREKFEMMAQDVDGYVQRNLVPLSKLERLMRKYSKLLLKIEALRPIEKQPNDLRKLPTNAVKLETANTNNFVHLTPRKAFFKVSEDMISLYSQKPGGPLYDRFVGVTDSGILAVAHTVQ